MSDTTCTCGKPTRDNAYVCETCLSELARALGEIPWTVEQLDISLQKARGVDYTTMGGSASSESPLPVSFPAFEALTNLRQVIVMWVRFCDEEAIRHQSPTTAFPKDTLVSMSRWLMWRIDGLALNDLGGDAVSEITRAVGRARQVIDRPAEKVYAGPCECGRDLYAKPKAKMTKCKGCEREYDVEEMRDWMRTAVTGRLVTAREGSTLLGRFDLPTAQKTIDSWHDRKRILDHGCNPTGARLYLIDDLIGLAANDGRMSA
ncbi:MAG: hypothetical protein JWP74_1743 [Marmoricola sp.]|nr:hypothetical protein [Marmoricola sp.]